MAEELLVSADRYLKTGSHIGTRYKHGNMRKFVFKIRQDGIRVMDIATIDQRLKMASRMLSKLEPNEILVVARKQYGRIPARIFAESIGAKCILGRFVPGTLTNPTAKSFIEPKIVIITEPDADKQALSEANKSRIQTIALCSTNNSLSKIDFVIPTNNKGRKSLALLYWVLAREYLLAKGILKKREDFEANYKEFEQEEERTEKPKERRSMVPERKITRNRRGRK